MNGTIESVVLAGGGSRCFWHAGFWAEAAGPLALAPRQFASVSAGGALACAIVAGVAEEALRQFKDASRSNKRNVYPANVFGSERVFPHERMYRAAIHDMIDETVLARLHAGPDIRLLVGRLPLWLGPRTGMLAAALAYNFDKRVRKLVHPRAPLALGFRPEIGTVRNCRNAQELADLIIASSCTPPMTALQRWNGAWALDGGVVDNVPLCALDTSPGETLVLLSRPHARLPERPGFTYVQPSQKVPVSAWDYTNPDGLQATYDLGRRDGEAFVRVHTARRQAAG